MKILLGLAVILGTVSYFIMWGLIINVFVFDGDKEELGVCTFVGLVLHVIIALVLFLSWIIGNALMQ